MSLNKAIEHQKDYFGIPRPQMILFDYGQTLVNEAAFDGVAGTRALLSYAVQNRDNLTAEQIQSEAEKINKELGRFDPKKRHLFQIEVPNSMFTQYLYESLGIELSLSNEEIDRVFWNASSPGQPAENIGELLSFLDKNNIRTGVISNISYCGKIVSERINTLIPDNNFEFIIATSEYMFRKPNRRIFELAILKAGLKAEDVWYCGDNFECDIIGAHNAGMFPVHYLEHPTKYQSGVRDVDFDYLKINDWRQMIEFLENK